MIVNRVIAKNQEVTKNFTYKTLNSLMMNCHLFISFLFGIYRGSFSLFHFHAIQHLFDVFFMWEKWKMNQKASLKKMDEKSLKFQRHFFMRKYILT